MSASVNLDSAGFGDLRWVELCDSTNTLVRSAVTELPAGAAPRAVAVADEQSAGRGRRDRRWEAPPGSALMLSVAHEAPDDPQLLGALPLAMGLAALEAIETVAGLALQLKWPNDLVVDRPAGGLAGGVPGGLLKVGGILGESFDDPRPGARAGRVAVLGIGINTGWETIRPDLPDATSLNLIIGAEVDRRALAEALLRRYRLWWRRLLDGGSDEFRAALIECSATLGRRVRVELPTSELVGTATSIAADGALEIVDDQGVHRHVTVGDVIHLRPDAG